VADTYILPFNDIEAVKRAVQEQKGNIACLILEPVAGNMGTVPPQPGYLEEIRKITATEGIVLIFDEVITGFRVAAGGAQELFGIKPDLTCLGKIIGGGMPVGAFGGDKAIMECLAPLGPVYQAGTLSGNPLAMAAGIATLEELGKPGFYEDLEKKASRLVAGMGQAAQKAGIQTQANRVGSMFATFFTPDPVINFTTASKSDTDRYRQFFWGMVEEGVYFAPSQFESAFVCQAHADADLEKTIQAAARVLPQIK
jgi:glutamate-1-semialdehyde 2,1-aminomutase